jgi:hypothetical protein
MTTIIIIEVQLAMRTFCKQELECAKKNTKKPKKTVILTPNGQMTIALVAPLPHPVMTNSKKVRQFPLFVSQAVMLLERHEQEQPTHPHQCERIQKHTETSRHQGLQEKKKSMAHQLVALHSLIQRCDTDTS